MENVEEVEKKSKRKESRFGMRYKFEFRLRCALVIGRRDSSFFIIKGGGSQ